MRVEARDVLYIGDNMITNDEIWATNLNHPKYLISSYGRIYNLYSNRYLKPTQNGEGYLRIKLRRNNSNPKDTKQWFVHNLVLDTFIGERPKDNICRHYPNPDKTCNNINNLQWGTQSENIQDRLELGSGTKLTPQEVINIKNDIINKRTCSDIAKQYNISDGIINNIKHGKMWTEIGPDLSNYEVTLGKGKFTKTDILNIKTRILNGESNIDIANDYNVHRGTISAIRTGKNHSKITGFSKG